MRLRNHRPACPADRGSTCELRARRVIRGAGAAVTGSAVWRSRASTSWRCFGERLVRPSPVMLISCSCAEGVGIIRIAPEWARTTEPDHPNELSNAEWTILLPLLEPPTCRGWPWPQDRCSVLNAMLYVLRGGIAWWSLPELSRSPSVYDQFRRWQRAGVWHRINDTLRERAGEVAGHNRQPTAVIIVS